MRAAAFVPGGTVSPVARRLVVTAAGALVGTAWTLLAINGGPDLFVLLPFAALGIAGVVLLLLGRMPRRAALAGAAVVVSLGVVVGSTFHGYWAYPWLQREYRRIGGGASFTWYLRRSAGHDALIRARIEHDEALTPFGRTPR